MKVLESKDCGNSPKNLFVQEMAVSFETGDLAPDSATEELVFHDRSGEIGINLTNPFPWLVDRAAPVEVHVLHASAHGRTGAANGVSTLEDGAKHPFSYVFEFKNTTAKCVAAVYRYD